MPKKRPRKKLPKQKPGKAATPPGDPIAEFFAVESAPPSSMMDELEIRGGTFPHPDELTAEALTPLLWRLIKSLACMRTYVSSTDHLDDRALYTYLWKDGLRESFVYTPGGMQGGFFLDLLGSGSEEDVEMRLRYYADTAERRRHAREGAKLPKKMKRPFDRDRFLPKCGRHFDAGPPFNPKKWKAPQPEEYLRADKRAKRQ